MHGVRLNHCLDNVVNSDIGVFYEITCYTCFVVGTFVNGLLVAAVLNTNSGHIRAYSNVFIGCCVVDLFLLTMSVVVQPVGSLDLIGIHIAVFLVLCNDRRTLSDVPQWSVCGARTTVELRPGRIVDVWLLPFDCHQRHTVYLPLSRDLQVLVC